MTTADTIEQFATDLAGALDRPVPTVAHTFMRAIDMGEWHILVRSDLTKPGRVRLAASYPDYHKISYTYGLKGNEPDSITVDPKRPLRTLVNDIEKRLVTPARTFAGYVAIRLAEEGDERKGLELHVARLKARFPKLKGEDNLADLRWDASIYVEAIGMMDFYVRPDGSFQIKRIMNLGSNREPGKDTTSLDRLIGIISAVTGQ